MVTLYCFHGMDRHSRAGGSLEVMARTVAWIPAFAGMTLDN